MSRPPSVSDRLARTVIRLAGGLPETAQRRLAGQSVRRGQRKLNAEMALGLRLLNLAAGKSFETLSLDDGRDQIDAEAWVVGDTRPHVTVSDLTVAGGAGPLAARLYRPADAGTASGGGLVYFHGGGWVLGGLDSADSVARVLAEKAESAVISVDYRLAPEAPYPAAVEDALAAFDDVCARAQSLGLNPSLVAVGGESAGGNLAAVVAQETARRTSGPAPCFQLLFMPVTDLTTKRPSYREFGEGYFLSECQMDWYAERYLPSAELARRPTVSPLLAEDLSGVAPALVITAECDVLRDEGEAYAARLAEAGVPAAVRRVPGIVHGSVNATGVGRSARETLAEAAGALRTAFSFTTTGGPR